jgi:DNA-binding CsgD family transcriptional regulator
MTSTKTIDDLCSTLFEHFSLDTFCYHLYRGDRYQLISNNTAWAKKFTQEQYFLYTPYALIRASKHPKVLLWSSLFNACCQSCQEYQRILQYNKLNQGAAIIIQTDDTLEVFEFASSNTDKRIMNQFCSELPLLKQFCAHVTQRIKNASLPLETFHYEIDKKALLQLVQQRHPHSIAIDSLDRISFLQHIDGINPHLLDVTFTNRQKEVIDHYVRGLTSKQIADAFGLSSRTVECYIDEIKIKIKCHNKVETVMRLFEMKNLGLI